MMTPEEARKSDVISKGQLPESAQETGRLTSTRELPVNGETKQ